MLILVLNLLTRIELGRHRWCASHAPRLCVGGPMARGVWTLEFPWFWGNRQNHVTDCYFCAVDVTGINRKNRGSLKYPDLQSARRPVAHCDEIPVPNFLTLVTKMPPHPFSQKELNDLFRDLSSSTDSAELLASWLKEKEASSLTVLPSASSATDIKSTSVFFLCSEGLGVLCRYCAASALA